MPRGGFPGLILLLKWMDLTQNLLRPSFYRISLTYGTERHTEAEIKKRLGFPTPFFVF